MRVRYKKIPTYDFETRTWTETSFSSQEEFAEFLESIFKEPGEYGFDECSLRWNQHARFFKKHNVFTITPAGTQDSIEFWDREKMKCRKWVIWKNNGKVWFTEGSYYKLINFLKVPANKEKGQNDAFCDVRDVQYHMALYGLLAAAKHRHAAILKRRQCMYSTYHAAKLINVYWHESSKRIKLLAYDDAYITGPQGTWSILESFRDFLNQNTEWKRASNPEEVGNWEQKEKRKDAAGRWSYYGRKSSIIAQTLQKDHKKGIGGPSFLVLYEEGGVAPTADKTLQFLQPAMESGSELVGMFIIGGSVGDLKDCKPLEKFIKHPTNYGMLGVPTKYYDSTGQVKICGLFIPAQYGHPSFVDKFGNSLVKEALEHLKTEDEFRKKNNNTYEYNVWKSQNPTTIEEAFNFREDLYFPAKEIQRQQDVLKTKAENRQTSYKQGLLDEVDGQIKFIPYADLKTPKPHEMEFPVDPKDFDKRGVVTIYEDPPTNAKFFIHFAGVDSIEANETTTSDSLFSVHIVRRAMKRIWYDEKGQKQETLENPKLMASYTGRFPDSEDTNKQGELLIRLYNAFAAVERNKPNFINHMRRKGFDRYVMKRKDLTLFKDVDSTGLSNDEYGIYFGADNKAEEILNEQIKDKIMQVLDVIYKKTAGGELTSDVVKKYRVLDYIEDYWLLEELKLWYHGLNTDRRISYGLAVVAANCYEMTYQATVQEKPPAKEERLIPMKVRTVFGTSRPLTNTKKRSRSLL